MILSNYQYQYLNHETKKQRTTPSFNYTVVIIELEAITRDTLILLVVLISHYISDILCF